MLLYTGGVPSSSLLPKVKSLGHRRPALPLFYETVAIRTRIDASWMVLHLPEI
jgi:hypothetical protein